MLDSREVTPDVSVGIAPSTGQEQGELRVDFQPVFSLEDSRITGFEALARWARPGCRVVPLSEFIPRCEGDWLALSVNISPPQLRDPELVRDVAWTLRETDVDPARVILEITESALVEDACGTIRSLAELKAVGVVSSLGGNERDDAVVRGIFERAVSARRVKRSRICRSSTIGLR